MQSWRRLVALALLALWMPAILHCQLEAAGVLATEECCDNEPAGSSDHCTKDACVILESGFAKSSPSASLPAPVLCACLLCDAFLPSLTLPDLAPDKGVIDRGTAPAEIAPTWQFAARAALSPRAPSSVS